MFQDLKAMLMMLILRFLLQLLFKVFHIYLIYQNILILGETQWLNEIVKESLKTSDNGQPVLIILEYKN